MHGTLKNALLSGTILLAGFSVAASAPAKNTGTNSVVIVFKDGHQQSFSMSEISRIEFKTPGEAAKATLMGRGEFIGKWRVGDGMGGKLDFTLFRDGSAIKNSSEPHGTWTVVDGEARISWDDGWRDVIRKAGNKYEKAAYAPGTSYAGATNNITDARRINPEPI
jgi:hypothetical protein